MNNNIINNKKGDRGVAFWYVQNMIILWISIL
jgi:hypothetical protein